MGAIRAADLRERERERESKISQIGVPIGNLTSQLFANIYLNEFDQFIKHELRIKNYVRYTDDFIIISEDSKYLQNLLSPIDLFLQKKLKLTLHPEKVTIRKYRQGIDFLGYILRPHHRTMRRRTERRLWRRFKQRLIDHQHGLVSDNSFTTLFNSYSGVISHCNGYRLTQQLNNEFWFGTKKQKQD